jgi:hypothetical protein
VKSFINPVQITLNRSPNVVSTSLVNYNLQSTGTFTFNLQAPATVPAGGIVTLSHTITTCAGCNDATLTSVKYNGATVSTFNMVIKARPSIAFTNFPTTIVKSTTVTGLLATLTGTFVNGVTMLATIQSGSGWFTPSLLTYTAASVSGTQTTFSFTAPSSAGTVCMYYNKGSGIYADSSFTDYSINGVAKPAGTNYCITVTN